jgi:hypothetical protein
MPDGSIYIRSKSVVSRAIAGETLVVPVRGRVGDLASIFSLNETGTALWEALSLPMTREALAILLTDQYEVAREQAEDELRLFLEEMCAAGLVEVAETSEHESCSATVSVI